MVSLDSFKFAVTQCMLVLSAAAWGTDYPITLVDGRGDATRVEARALRVVSIAPSTTGIVVELQGLEQLVGVSKHCQLPAEAGAVLRVPVYPAPSTEILLSLKPDLILAADITSPQTVAQLRRVGLKVLVLNSKGLNGVLEDIRLVGQALDLTPAAERLITDFQAVRARLDTVLQTSDDPPPRVLMALSPALDYCVGRGVYADALIAEAGGQNVAQGTGISWPKLSIEGVLAMRPEVIIIVSDTVSAAAQQQMLEHFQKHPIWKVLPAVRLGRVYLVHRELFSVPGPCLQEALQVLFAHLHPELAQF